MDLTEYKKRSPQVTEVEAGWVRAFVGDDIPRIAHALGIRSEDGDEFFAAVRRHAGGRLVDAMLLEVPGWLSVGDEVFTTEKEAHVPAPRGGKTDLSALSFSAGDGDETIPFRLRTPSFSEVAGGRPPFETGLSALDRLAPLAEGGLNLVLDAYDEPVAFDQLAERSHRALQADARLWLANDGREASWASHQIIAGRSAQRRLAALRVLMSWAGSMRDEGRNILLCAELPPLTSRGTTDEVETALGVSIGEVIDQLGSTMSSTQDGQITVILRLPLFESAAGIEHIIETMDVGDVDAQTFIDEHGRFDPYRSTSDADLDKEAASEQRRLLSVLSRASAARDKSAMLGEFGLEEKEQKALDAVEDLQESLVD